MSERFEWFFLEVGYQTPPGMSQIREGDLAFDSYEMSAGMEDLFAVNPQGTIESVGQDRVLSLLDEQKTDAWKVGGVEDVDMPSLDYHDKVRTAIQGILNGARRDGVDVNFSCHEILFSQPALSTLEKSQLSDVLASNAMGLPVELKARLKRILRYHDRVGRGTAIRKPEGIYCRWNGEKWMNYATYTLAVNGEPWFLFEEGNLKVPATVGFGWSCPHDII